MDLPINDQDLETIVKALALGGDSRLFFKLKEVKEIREKLIAKGYHMPISWEVEKSAIIYNNKEQDKYKTPSPK